MKTNIGIAVLSCVSALMLVSGNAQAAAVNAGASVNDYAAPEVLIQKANALAKSELAKLAAAEMVYRDNVAIHCYVIEQTAGQPQRLYMKLFRRFTGYELVDIVRTPSILTPLKISIRYNFDRIGTRPVSGGIADTNLAKQVKADVALIVHDSQSIVREYVCSPQGDVATLPSPILDRPNFWWKSTGALPYGTAWLEDPYAIPGG